MPKKMSPIEIRPMTREFDARSEPADLPGGVFRWKQNWAVTRANRLSRRRGFLRSFSDYLYDEGGDLCTDTTPSGTTCTYRNHDHRDQSSPRKPILTLFRSIAPDGSLTLFDATEDKIYYLNESTGYWNHIHTASVVGKRWQMASLRDWTVMTNDAEDVQFYELGSGSTTYSGELKNDVGVTKARVAISFSGVVMLMNYFQDGEQQATRIRWCDLNDATTWKIDGAVNICGYQDLGYGEDVLAAKILGGTVIVYTKNGIWRGYVAASTNAFSFVKIYGEPEAQSGLLAYPHTLCSDGEAHYYMGKDGIYKLSPFSPSPIRMEWIDKSAAIIYDTERYSSYALAGDDCEAPVGHYDPANKELWFSWASADSAFGNNHTLVCNVKAETCDYVDTGFSSFVHFTKGDECTSISGYFIGASTEDYAHKQMNTGYKREFVDVGTDRTAPRTLPIYTDSGYKSIIRGEIPLGKVDRQKTLTRCMIDHATPADSSPPVINMRLGMSNVTQDVNDLTGACSVQWKTFPQRSLSCPETTTPAQHELKGTKQSSSTNWPIWVKARHIYYEFTITETNGADAQGGETYWSMIQFHGKANQT